MTRAVPNPSARAEWFLAGIIERAWHHQGHVPPLTDPSDCDHADSETDTAVPDDDDDIASLARQSFASVQLSSIYLLGSALTEQFASALR